MQINPLDYVLVVDDSSSMLRIVRNIITQLGYKNIDTALSGREALQKTKGTAYKLILSDWNMENMTDIELLRHVRKTQNAPTNNNVPFVLITAEAKPENVLAAKEALVNGYIVKPFSADKLKATIEAL